MYTVGVRVVSSCPSFAYQYALNVIKGPWSKGEAAIAKDEKYTKLYAKNIIGPKR